MADIELVIKISEDDYKEVREDTYSGTPFENRVFSAIANGTPLDKHDEEVIAETVESIWGKPPYIEVLDKIKAEIRDFSFVRESGTYYIMTYIVNQIIDKYKTKSEVEE